MLRPISKAKGVKAMEKSISGILLPVGSLSLQDGGCRQTATILPKVSPLDSKRAFGARLFTLSKRQERHDGKTEGENQISETADTQT
mgnify:CR=1 FL=1